MAATLRWPHACSPSRVPEISRFLGIVIGMFHQEHGRPHFHARFGEYRVSVEIETGVVRGSFPDRVLGLVLDWAEQHRAELLQNWERCQRGLPPRPIDPLE